MPPTDVPTIVELISATTIKTELTLPAIYDQNCYERGTMISDEDFDVILIRCQSFHGDCSYTILPRDPV